MTTESLFFGHCLASVLAVSKYWKPLFPFKIEPLGLVQSFCGDDFWTKQTSRKDKMNPIKRNLTIHACLNNRENGEISSEKIPNCVIFILSY
jgi:hypothetical protein